MIDWDYIVSLLYLYPKKLKIRNSNNPEIIIKDKILSTLKKILKFLNRQVYSIEE
jgi:hypothetical protein